MIHGVDDEHPAADDHFYRRRSFPEPAMRRVGVPIQQLATKNIPAKTIATNFLSMKPSGG
jgi:hypothetical protein